MARPSPLAGPLPALITPLDDGHRIDMRAFERHLHRALDHGMRGIVIGGSTGEGPSVAADDRARLVRAAVEAAGDRPVVACVCGLTLDDVHRDVERAADAGAAAVLCLAPFYFSLSPAEQVATFHAVADRSPIPLVAYHIPQLTGSSLTVAAVAELAAHDRVVGMKDSSGDLARFREFTAATEQAAFGLFQGNGAGVFDALEAGAAGSITAVANVRPAEIVALHAAMDDGRPNAGRSPQAHLAAVSAALDAVPGPLAVAIKALLEIEGELDNRRCVPPLAPADEAAVAQLRTAVAHLPRDADTS